MLLPGVFALVVGLAFGALWARVRMRAALVAAVAWLAYAPYEYLMYLRVLCSGDCNIRVDLLLLWPVLLVSGLAVPVVYLLGRAGRRERPPR